MHKRNQDLAVQKRSVAAVRPVIELGGELKILLSGVTRFGYAGQPVLDDLGHVVGILVIATNRIHGSGSEAQKPIRFGGLAIPSVLFCRRVHRWQKRVC